MDFQSWLAEASAWVAANEGLPLDEFPELPGFWWHDFYDDGYTPKEVAVIWSEQLDVYARMYF